MSGRSFSPTFMVATVATSEPPFVIPMSASEALRVGKKDTLVLPRTRTSIPRAFDAVASTRNLRTLGPNKRARMKRRIMARITPPAIQMILFLRFAMSHPSWPEIDAGPNFRRPPGIADKAGKIAEIRFP
jgi:hypothetical protein